MEFMPPDFVANLTQLQHNLCAEFHHLIYGQIKEARHTFR
jgi:hypothetical protein